MVYDPQDAQNRRDIEPLPEWKGPSIQAMDKIRLFDEYDAVHGHDDPWARAVWVDWDEHPNSPTNSAGKPWSEDELALIKWYKEEVYPEDKWLAIFAKSRTDPYFEKEAPQFETKNVPENYKLPKHETVPTHEYKGVDNSSKDLAVSTEAIRHLAQQLRVPLDSNYVENARVKFVGLDVRPGGFARAEKLRQALHGPAGSPSEGLIAETMAVLEKVKTVLTEVSVSLKAMADSYDNAEEFNALTSTKLADDMKRAWETIDSLS